MTCPFCKKDIPDDSTVCPECQEPINSSNQVSESSQTQPSNHQTTEISELVYHQKKIIRLCCIILAFLIIGSICVSVLVFQRLTTKNQVLVVWVETDENSGTLSDYTQIQNALRKGGMIHISLTQITSSSSSLSIEIQSYGAANDAGNYYVLGAFLNYVASKGWELVQSPSSGLSNHYYFVKH